MVIIISYILFFGKEKSYELNYLVDNYKISESYNTNTHSYLIDLFIDDKDYKFIYSANYSNKRKLVNSINNYDDNCYSLNVNGVLSYTLCNNDEEYYINNIEATNSTSNEYNSVNVYNKSHTYYIWNGYGLTNVLTNKKYNFLINESYNNNSYYILGDNIIVADYDDKHDFSKFYVFNNKSKSVKEIDTKYSISSDFYFLGDIDNEIYLFDTKNVKEYKINVKKSKVTKVNDKNGGPFYDKEWTTKTLKELTYNKEQFVYNDRFTYSLDNNKLYMNIEDYKILISNLEVTDIIGYNEDNIFYIVDDTVYSFNLDLGTTKLLDYFEWKFSYKGKIFIFD